MICDKTHLNRRWSLEACIPIMCLSLGRSGSTETSVGLCSCEAGRHFPPASLWPGTFSHHTHPGTTSALSSSAYHSELALLCWPQFHLPISPQCIHLHSCTWQRSPPSCRSQTPRLCTASCTGVLGLPLSSNKKSANAVLPLVSESDLVSATATVVLLLNLNDFVEAVPFSVQKATCA